jgi:hypothetical protein
MVPRTSDIALSAYPGGCYPINVERFTSSAQMRGEDLGDTGMRGRPGLGAA